ncbi:MAG: PBSX family phage terminase large subunit [Defluviitaleaceae bacterium]|nr:PBSX family phage terminase large subunit [Defluviitaleaceae bacterium]
MTKDMDRNITMMISYTDNMASPPLYRDLRQPPFYVIVHLYCIGLGEFCQAYFISVLFGGFVMEYVGFSDKQRRYLLGSLDAWLNVAEGGKRAGKNVVNVLGFAMAVEGSSERLHLVAGVTKSCALLNVLDCNGFGLRRFFEGRSYFGKYEGRDALVVQTAVGEKVVVVEGGGRASDAARIKGASFGCVYLTEVNEMHPGFFFEAMDRTIASVGRKVFLDLNAKPPGHWFYREFLDFQVKAGDGVNYGHFTIFDNLAVSVERREEVLASYDKGSGWYKRDILGLREGGVGGIYVGFGKANEELGIRNEELKYRYMSVGVDVGGRDATVATLVGVTVCGQLHLVDGFYHRQGDGDGMTHEVYVRMLGEKIGQWCERFDSLAFSGAVFCESAEKMFRASLVRELRGRGLGTQVHPSYKRDGVLDRIRLFAMLVQQGRFFVAGHLKEWISAFYEARWCEKARERGDWVRVDDGSYSVDCLDSAEYGAVPFKKILIRG